MEEIMLQSNMLRLRAAVALAGALGMPSLTVAADKLTAKLDGFQEVPLCSSLARGRFEALINNDETAVEYTLRYDGAEGAVKFAHIHLGKPTDAGGIIVFLCGGGGKPDCPAPPATITGSLFPADVTGPVTQGIAAGDFGEFLRDMRAGLTYANVHSAACPNGELRGQIKRKRKG
jgi:hypothetical protein